MSQKKEREIPGKLPSHYCPSEKSLWKGCNKKKCFVVLVCLEVKGCGGEKGVLEKTTLNHPPVVRDVNGEEIRPGV